MSIQPKPRRDYADLLDELIQVGAQLVRTLPEQPGKDTALDYHLLCQAVRRSVRLLGQTRRPARAPRTKLRTAARKRIVREIHDAIQQHAHGTQAETLRAELLDRLEAPDLDADIDARPIADIVADIARDLGIADPVAGRPPPRRTPEDIKYLCALASHRRGNPRPVPP